ncbi:uncharacterized protein [Periplaneta americana]|uniref:uncharacterized protein n=1 Tax=Periplaneta americana TaxID=6978 RepID=UPI0037E945A2
METEERLPSSKIKKLPTEVQSALRSGVVITSMAQCIVELVLNSIDAGATSIAIRVNFKFYKIQVVDNGCGMDLRDLDLLGTRYMTSKCHSLQDFRHHLNQFGFRGEALASLRELSGLLSLESRPRGSDVTYCKVFTHGKAQRACVSATVRAGQGTTITVTDFMYNMPVRRQRIRAVIDLGEIKSHIEAIAVMQPQISFSLRNDTDGSLILHTRKCSDTINTFSNLFGQTIAQTLGETNVTLDEFRISGYIGRLPHTQKNLQLIYVNKRLLLKTKLHKLVNSMLGNSFILRTNAVSHDRPISDKMTAGRWLAFSPPRRRERYAVYLLNVECPYAVYDICLDPKKTLIEFCNWDKVIECMETAVKTFLEREYSESLSQRHSIEGRNNAKDLSLLEEVEELDRECVLREVKDDLSRYESSGVKYRKALNTSRAVVGKPAKRGKDNEDDVCSPEETAVQFDTCFSISADNNLMNPVSHHGLENPFPDSDSVKMTHQNLIPVFQTQRQVSKLKIRRTRDNVVSDLNEIPIIESGCESSTQNTLMKTYPDLRPMDRFRNLITRQKFVTCQSDFGDIAPITKFRQTFQCLSSIQITKPLKHFEDELLQHLQNFMLMRKDLSSHRLCDGRNFTVSVRDVESSGRLKVPSELLDCSKIPSHFRHALQELLEMHRERGKKFLDKTDGGLAVGSTSRIVTSVNVGKPVFKNENTRISRTDISLSKLFDHCKAKQFLRTVADEDVYPHQITTVEESVEFRIPRKRKRHSTDVTVHHCVVSDTGDAAVEDKRRKSVTNFYNKTHERFPNLGAQRNECVRNMQEAQIGKKVAQINEINSSRISSSIFSTEDNFMQTGELCKRRTSIEDVNSKTKDQNINICIPNQYMSYKGDVLSTCASETCAILPKIGSKNTEGILMNKHVNLSTETHFKKPIWKSTMVENNQQIPLLSSENHQKSLDRNHGSFKNYTTSQNFLKAINMQKTYGSTFQSIQSAEFLNEITSLNHRMDASSLHDDVRCVFSSPSIAQCPEDVSFSSLTEIRSKSVDKDMLMVQNSVRNKKQSDVISGKQTVESTVVLSSGSEADIESSSNTQLWPRRKKHLYKMSFKNFWDRNKRVSNTRVLSNCSERQQTVSSCSEDSIIRKISTGRSYKGGKLDVLLEEQDFEEMTGIQQNSEKNTLNNLSDVSIIDLCSSFSEVVAEKDDMSDDTIVPSSGSMAGAFESVITGHKTVISESSYDDSVHSQATNRYLASPNDKTKRESQLSSINSDSNREQNRENKADASEAEDSSLIDFAKLSLEKGTENVNCEKSYPESSPTLLSGVICNLKLADISRSNDTESSIRGVRNEDMSQAEVGVSNKQSNKKTIENVNVFQTQNSSHSELSALSTDARKQDETRERILGHCKTVESESLFLDSDKSLSFKWSPQKSIKHGEEPDSPRRIFEVSDYSIPCGQEPVSASNVLTQKISKASCIESESTEILTENKHLPRGNQSLSSKESPLRSVEICNEVNNCTLTDNEGENELKRNESKLDNVQLPLPLNNEPLCSNSSQGESNTERFVNVQQDNGCSLERDADKQKEKSSESIQCINQNVNGEIRNELSDYITSPNSITCAPVSQMLTSKSPVTAACQNSSLSAEILGNDASIKQFDLLNRKRKSRNNCVDNSAKKICTEGQSTDIASRITEHAPEMYISKSITTQELNEVFDKVMNVTVADISSPKNSTFSAGDSTEAGIGAETGSKSRDSECSRKQSVDPKCKTSFAHSESDSASFNMPKLEHKLYSMSKRFAFLPKGLSQVLQNEVKANYIESKQKTSSRESHQMLSEVVTESFGEVDELAVVKWKDGPEEVKRTDCRDLVTLMLEQADSRMQFYEKPVPNACVREMPRNIVKVYNSVFPYTFTKDMLPKFKVLGQLDNKFIVTLLGPWSGKNMNVIVLFDQHAVHERIRLESLMKEYCVEGSDSEFKTSEVNPPVTLQLSDGDIRVVSSFEKAFTSLGLRYEVLNSTDLRITSVPTCLMAREMRERQGRNNSVLQRFLESMVREQVESIMTTRGVGTRVPSIIKSVVSSEACRGAIKFGDALFPEECEVLLQSLATCQVPFQCAHGRPVLTPVVDLQSHQMPQPRVRPKPQLWKLKKV